MREFWIFDLGLTRSERLPTIVAKIKVNDCGSTEIYPKRERIITASTPLDTLRNLEQLYQSGFRDPVTDAALLKIASSQAARDEATLRDLERDLGELEQQYQMSSEEFF